MVRELLLCSSCLFQAGNLPWVTMAAGLQKESGLSLLSCLPCKCYFYLADWMTFHSSAIHGTDGSGFWNPLAFLLIYGICTCIMSSQAKDFHYLSGTNIWEPSKSLLDTIQSSVNKIFLNENNSLKQCIVTHLQHILLSHLFLEHFLQLCPRFISIIHWSYAEPTL